MTKNIAHWHLFLCRVWTQRLAARPRDNPTICYPSSQILTQCVINLNTRNYSDFATLHFQKAAKKRIKWYTNQTTLSRNRGLLNFRKKTNFFLDQETFIDIHVDRGGDITPCGVIPFLATQVALHLWITGSLTGHSFDTSVALRLVSLLLCSWQLSYPVQNLILSELWSSNRSRHDISLRSILLPHQCHFWKVWDCLALLSKYLAARRHSRGGCTL